MSKCAESMEKIRIEYANELSEKINTELKDLEMLNSIFEIKIERLQEFNINGLNKVEFYICTNIGETTKPLVKK